MFPIKNLKPFDRHKYILNNYVLNKSKSKEKRDADIIRENHKFLWDDDDETPNSWEERLSKKYYDKLFKEYCISDLTYYKENKIALRWRIEKEVVLGKGQFICGNKTCQEQEHLRTWEVNFAYIEKGEKKNALIKLRLCPPCSEKLNYKSKKREIKRQKHTQRKQSDKRRSKSKKSEISEASSSESIPDNKALESTSNSDIEECSGEQEANIWDGKDKAVDNIVREDEFGKYLEDLLL